jgi:hypothetical protein
MQWIEIKAGTLGGAKMTTTELIKKILDTTPEGGFKLSDYKKRNRIDRAIDAQEKKASELAVPEGELKLTQLNLEDDDYETLRQIIKSTKGWATREPFLVDFLLSFE